MTTLTLNKKNFWQKMSLIYKKINTFWELKIKLEQKDPTIRLQKLVDDPNNTSYWPFNNADDFLKHLHSNKD